MALRVWRNACPSIDAATSARKHLECEIAKHAYAIIDLKGRINAIAPISKLPPELLSAIFTEVAINHYTCRTPRLYHSAAGLPYKWITLTHVCHAWRAIALDTPRLWSRIVLTRPDVTREVLARSKKAPLWVSANMSYMNGPQWDILDTIMQESSRLKELSIAGPARVLENLYPKWTGYANILESLTLSDNNVFDPVAISIFPQHPSVPVLFQGSTPNLRHLDVHHVAVGWDNPLFCSTLTSLTVVSRYDNTHKLGNFGQLLLALENMSALETLELNEAVPRLGEAPANVFTPLRRITLANLRKLHLISDAVNCANFLNFVTLPPTTRLLVTGRNERGVEELVHVFAAHLARAQPLLTARLAPVYSAQVYLRGWWAFLEGAVIPGGTPDVELYLDAFPHSQAMHHLMACATFLARVRRLDIQPLFSAWDWHGLFAHTPELRVLSVSGHPEGDFLVALSKVQLRDDGGTSASGQRQGQGRRMLAPELHTVQFSGVRFGCTHPEHEQAYLEEMIDWLMVRSNEGVPIATLELTDVVNGGGGEVERLREVVADVVWDELETWEDEYRESEDEYGVPDEEMYYDDEGPLPLFPPEWDHVYNDEDDLEWIIPFFG